MRYARVLLEQIEALRGQPRETRPSPDALAQALRSLGDELEKPGWYDLARLAYLEVIEDYGTDVAVDHLDDFRRALQSLGDVLVELGCLEEALPILREVQSVSLRLAVVDASALDLANDAHTRFIGILVRLGRHDEALESAAAAISDIRQQPADGPGRNRGFTLAYALGRYTDCLTSVGRFDEAVEAATEALTIWRDYLHAGEEPAWLVKNYYVKALRSLGDALAWVGRYEEAHTALTQSVEVYRQPIDADEEDLPFRHLADTLSNVATDLGRLGRHLEALVAAEEAVSHLREIAARKTDRLQRLERLFPDEEAFFDGHDQPMGRELFEDGGLIEARDLLDDEELTEEDLDDLECDQDNYHVNESRADVREAELSLCVSLYNLGVHLHDLNRVDEALAADSEAVEIARRHQDTAEQLSLALNNKSCTLASLNRQEEALEAAREAVALCGTLAATDPETHEQRLALAQHTFCVSAVNVGRYEEALSASLQSLDIYRRLHQLDPHRLAGDLAYALADHGLVRFRRGEHAEALMATAESVEIYRRPAAQHPARYSSRYAYALLMFAEVRMATDGAHADGRAAAEEAVALYQSLAAGLPEAYEHRLAHAHSVLRRLE